MILRLSKNIILVFYFIYFGIALAEVKEDVYGKADGYPIARDFPYSYEPKFRVGSYSGRATDEFYKDRDIYFKATALERKIQTLTVKFPIGNDPAVILNKHPVLAMMLIKDGNIVFEKYQYGTNEKSRFTSEYMAKSFTALAVGKAVEEGYIKNLDQKISEIVPELAGSPVGNATVRQSLNMVCGHKFKFGGDTAFEYLKIKFGGKEHTKYTNIYDYYRDLTPEESGKKFSYDPHCTDALSMVMSKTTGKRLGKYFDEKIWSNLNTLERGSWMNMSINRNIDSGANLFHASLHDYSQIALMVLNDGLVDGRQVVSKEWINQMTNDSVSTGDYPSRYKKYGYQTWIRNSSSGSWFAFLGFNGQRIYIDKASNSILIAIALEESHVGDTDRFWEWFVSKSISNLK